MSFIDSIKERAKSNKKRIVLPETMDKRVIEAAEKILKEDIAEIILVGKTEEIEKISYGYDIGKDNKDIWYTVPNNVSSIFVDPISGKPVTDDLSKKKLMYFLKGTEPNITDQVFDEISSNQMAT